MSRKLCGAAILLMVFSVVFSYQSVFGFRLLPVLLIGSFFLVLLSGMYFKINAHVFFYALMMVYCAIASVLHFELNVFFSMIVFGWLAYWPFFIKRKIILQVDLEKLLRRYVLMGVVLSLGLFLQVLLYRVFGFEFGRIEFMLNRDAFGFIWSDFSFLSLFFASLLPIVWRGSARTATKCILSSVFMVASLLTSARTGFVALIIVFLLILLVGVARVFIVGKIKVFVLYLVASFFLVVPLLGYVATIYFPRISSLSSSGRMEGYISGFNFFLDNVFLGAKFNIIEYKESIDIIPHNLFVYLLVVGGLIFLLLFILWAVSLILSLLRTLDLWLAISLTISLVGFQFIPSFFSAYYFAFFLSICMVFHEQRLAKLNCDEQECQLSSESISL